MTAESGTPALARRLRRRQVAEMQRTRILSAMSAVSGERGVSNVTVAHVLERARVSRRTFYELFDDCESCLLSALDEAVARASQRVLAVDDPREPWRERVRVSLIALLQFLEEEPALGRLLIVEWLGTGPSVLARRSHVLARLIAAVDEGRADVRARTVPPSVMAEGIVGGILSVLHRRMVEPEQWSPIELVNPFMSMIVLPYHGASAARVELERPVVVLECKPDPSRDLPIELDMRFTYRTMRVLSAIGARPGSSNRQVGFAAGVDDPGQISKLLHRLRLLGLIENTEEDGKKGFPNAWTLSSTGAELERTIAASPGLIADGVAPPLS